MDMTAIITRSQPLSDSTDSLLRFAMRLDATLTGVLGLAIAAMADPLARLTGLTAAQGYIAGAAFVLCGLVVYALAAAPDLRRVGTAMAVFNGVGTVGLVAVAASGVLPLTTFGVITALAAGLYTATFAVLQYLGVRRLV
jgi:multidrug transporter EmrE-like cation transporter